MKNDRILKICLAGLLIAMGIIIPMFSPLKIIIEPASFTLASHVAIFIAMFISPSVAIAVCIGTTVGFFLGGFPIIIVLRAASHVIYAAIGSLYLHEIAKKRLTEKKLWIFSACIGFIHAVVEIAIVTAFYVSLTVGDAYYEKGYFVTVILLVGLGTVIHSVIDFKLAHIVALALRQQKNLKKLFEKV
ncbi:MAG: hypothetical protein FWD48_08920 [Oscillospiraceae bacterium]|nr:hypothetical protein [Oscillospiraceae bacterium]